MFEKLDRLDKISAVSILLLACGIVSLIVFQSQGSQSAQVPDRQELLVQGYFSPELENKVNVANDLLANDNPAELELLLNELLAQYPYDGRLHMLRGDLLVRLQQPVAAMLAFRKAVDLNPDFLDKKAPLFQGKKIRVNLQEVEQVLLGQQDEGAGLDGVQESRKVLHYMKRKLAGSCG